MKNAFIEVDFVTANTLDTDEWSFIDYSKTRDVYIFKKKEAKNVKR